MELVLVGSEPVDAVEDFQGRDQEVVKVQISQRAFQSFLFGNELLKSSPQLLRSGQGERAEIELGQDVRAVDGHLIRGVEVGRRTRSDIRVSSPIIGQEGIKDLSVAATRVFESIAPDIHSTPNHVRERVVGGLNEFQASLVLHGVSIPNQASIKAGTRCTAAPSRVNGDMRHPQSAGVWQFAISKQLSLDNRRRPGVR
jgi:hypothetical protein